MFQAVLVVWDRFLGGSHFLIRLGQLIMNEQLSQRIEPREGALKLLLTEQLHGFVVPHHHGAVAFQNGIPQGHAGIALLGGACLGKQCLRLLGQTKGKKDGVFRALVGCLAFLLCDALCGCGAVGSALPGVVEAARSRIDHLRPP